LAEDEDSMPGKPIAERLQVKGTRRLAVLGAPSALDHAVGVATQRAPLAEADVVLLLVPDRAQLDAELPEVLATASALAILWLAYPKLTSRLAGDLNRDVIRGLAPAYGLDTVSQIALDDDWSALRLKRVG
jgi:hypothetical protein